jgi:hypothetical protein
MQKIPNLRTVPVIAVSAGETQGEQAGLHQSRSQSISD